MTEQRIRYQIKLESSIIFCSLKEGEADIFLNSELDIKKYRTKTISIDSMTVYFISNHPDLKKSSKSFNKETSNIFEIIKTLITDMRSSVELQIQKNNDKTRRMIHNLISLNAKNIQNYYSLVPQNQKINQNYINKVSSLIEKNPKKTAEILIKIIKNEQAEKIEFSVFNKLHEKTSGIKSNIRKEKHSVHQVLMNTYYLFFLDIVSEKNINIRISESDIRATFDYETISVILFHLFENAYKYSLPDSNMEITISEEGSKCKISITMTSIEITESDKANIFSTEDWSSILSKQLKKSGYGIGMFISKKLMELNDGSITVETKPETKQERMGIPYQTNIFNLFLPIT